MGFWLLKTEPQEWSWVHQAANGGLSHWDGIRNPQAQKYLKAMAVGDLCMFYHSGKSKEVIGIVRVAKAFYPDPSDSSGKGGIVDVREVSTFRKPVTLARLKADGTLKEFVLFRQPRLSVVPVDDDVWKRICELGDEEIVEPEASGVLHTEKKKPKEKSNTQENTEAALREKPVLSLKRNSSGRVLSINRRQTGMKKKPREANANEHGQTG